MKRERTEYDNASTPDRPDQEFPRLDGTPETRLDHLITQRSVADAYARHAGSGWSLHCSHRQQLAAPNWTTGGNIDCLWTVMAGQPRLRMFGIF
jgi:hypothetical protein